MSAKTATTIEEQIAKMISRGMIIDDIEKAKKFLLNNSYYRVGSYSFPFEEKYPQVIDRDHKLKKGTNFNDVIELYNFDFIIRNLLLKYISIVETSIKTAITYIVSNHYTSSSTWFVDPGVVEKSYLSEFDKKVYTAKFRLNKVIKNHHLKYPKDSYAPAWKTIEFMTLGAVIELFKSIIDSLLKNQIAKKYNIKSTKIFINYIQSIRDLRNLCAHGSVIFDMRLKMGLKKGPATPILKDEMKTNLCGITCLIEYFLRQIDPINAECFMREKGHIINKYKNNPVLKPIIEWHYPINCVNDNA